MFWVACILKKSNLPFQLMSMLIAKGSHNLTGPRLDRTPHSNSLQGPAHFLQL